MPSFSTLARLVDDVRSSFWFVPGLAMFAIVSLWLGTTWLDRHPALIAQIPIASWLTITTIDSASTILTAIMSATISVVSLTFSITIVVLTLASGQFGSRLLYTFMRDHTTQLVLGAYSSTFVYALLTLRVLGSGTDQYIPALTIQTAIVLMLASVLLLVFFIHHISVSLQVTTVVNAVGQELDAVIDRFFPLDAVEEIPFSGASHSTLFFAKKSGILQAIDQRTLLKLAIRNEVQFCLCYRPGHFVVKGTPLMEVHYELKTDTPNSEHDQKLETLAADVQSTFAFGNRRTLVQDVEFGFQQLAEIAVRALSPGINDPNTARICIDQTVRGLAKILHRAMPPCCLIDDDNQCRVWLNRPDFQGLVSAALSQVRQHAVGDISVAIHLLSGLNVLLQLSRTDEQRKFLFQQANALYRAFDDEPLADIDRKDLEQRFTEVKETSQIAIA